MRVLMFSTDRTILQAGSQAQERMKDYAALVDKLFVFVITKKQPANNEIQVISDHLIIYPVWFWNVQRMVRDLRSQGINLVTAQDPFEIGWLGYRATRKLKAKLQLQIHTDFLSPYFAKESLKNCLRVRVAKWLLPKADSIRVVSQRIKDSLSKVKSQKSKVIVLPIFVDFNKIQAEPATFDLHEKYSQFSFIILMTSRFEEEKNIGLAIAVMKELVKIDPKIGLVIVGDGSLRKKLESQVVEDKLNNNVVFTGWVSDLISYYKTADMFLSTSNYEGYGMSMIMTGAATTSIVTTNVGLVGEILNEDNSLVVPVGNKQRIIESILQLKSDPDFSKKLAQRAQQAISSLGSKEDYLKKYKQSWETASL